MCQDGNSARDGDNSDESSDEEIFRLVLEDDDNDFMNGMLLYIIHHDKYCNIRAKRRKPMLIELEWVERKLGDRNSYYNMFRMSPTVFHRLHDLLQSRMACNLVPRVPRLRLQECSCGCLEHHSQLGKLRIDLRDHQAQFTTTLRKFCKVWLSQLQTLLNQWTQNSEQPQVPSLLQQLYRSNRWHSHAMCGAK